MYQATCQSLTSGFFTLIAIQNSILKFFYVSFRNYINLCVSSNMSLTTGFFTLIDIQMYGIYQCLICHTPGQHSTPWYKCWQWYCFWEYLFVEEVYGTATVDINEVHICVFHEYLSTSGHYFCVGSTHLLKRKPCEVQHLIARLETMLRIFFHFHFGFLDTVNIVYLCI